MSGNHQIPESWDDAAEEDVVAPISSTLAKFNVNAMEFVPSFAKSPSFEASPGEYGICNDVVTLITEL